MYVTKDNPKPPIRFNFSPQSLDACYVLSMLVLSINILYTRKFQNAFAVQSEKNTVLTLSDIVNIKILFTGYIDCTLNIVFRPYQFTLECAL